MSKKNITLKWSIPLVAMILSPLAVGEDKLPKFEREPFVHKVESGKWTGPKLKDGQPDVSGHWSNTIANHTNLTDPQGHTPGEESRRPLKKERAPSRVSEPSDGQVPFQAWAREKQQEFYKNFSNPTKPEYIEPLARCAPGGPSKSFMWHGFEVAQYPSYVVFFFDSGTRVIHLDKKPHLNEKIKLWNGDSRGHWEGNTLVVDVTNNNSKARFGRSGEFASDNVHIKEKFIFDNNRERFLYQAVYDDPTVYTQPWTLTIPAKRVETYAEDGWNNQLQLAKHSGKDKLLENYERICTENNGGFGNGAVKAN